MVRQRRPPTTGTDARLGSQAADRLLDVTEAARMLGVQPRTLYQWAYQRRIPVVKLLGRALRFRQTDLERLIAEGHRPALRSLLDGQ